MRINGGTARNTVPVNDSKVLLTTMNQLPAPPAHTYKQIKFRVIKAKAMGIAEKKIMIRNAMIKMRLKNQSTETGNLQ